jgi:nucleotide-binding universal stress UspA family protein
MLPHAVMTLPKKLLVPTDFGTGSQVALDEAIELARVFGAEIFVLHAYEIPVMGFPDGTLVATADLAARIAEGAREGLDRVVRDNGGRGVELGAILEEGEPWRVIEDAIGAHGIELVVMATHGRRGLPRALLGSVAEKVVRTASCPVLTVRGPAMAAAA